MSGNRFNYYRANSRHRVTLSEYYAFNLDDLEVAMPSLCEKWAIRKQGKDLSPNLIPLFYRNREPLTNLYRGRDYTVSFVLDRSRGQAPDKALRNRRLRTVEKAGDYCAIVNGISPRLKGEVVVPFTVERHSFAPAFIAAVAIAMVCVLCFFLLPIHG